MPVSAGGACLGRARLSRLQNVASRVAGRSADEAPPEKVVAEDAQLLLGSREQPLPLQHVSHVHDWHNDNVEAVEQELGGVVVASLHPVVQADTLPRQPVLQPARGAVPIVGTASEFLARHFTVALLKAPCWLRQ